MVSRPCADLNDFGMGLHACFRLIPRNYSCGCRTGFNRSRRPQRVVRKMGEFQHGHKQDCFHHTLTARRSKFKTISITYIPVLTKSSLASTLGVPIRSKRKAAPLASTLGVPIRSKLWPAMKSAAPGEIALAAPVKTVVINRSDAPFRSRSYEAYRLGKLAFPHASSYLTAGCPLGGRMTPIRTVVPCIVRGTHMDRHKPTPIIQALNRSRHSARAPG